MNQWYNDEDDQDLPPSKSQLKREMHALQQLGSKIVKLSIGQYATIPLEGILKEAIDTARRIKSREGLRRQMQFIGKLLREMDTAPIEQAFSELESGRVNAAIRFQELEQWRDRLVQEGPNSVEGVLEQYPQADRQHLRQLVLQAGKEQKTNKPPAAARKIFKYLRELDKQ
ncbi:ribosome biogenesis factor YjgA [Dasania marina]|uniref:ribosome biogenesis factor YjgA n=1 Tax=Dasania marina TaxID=471499 RepID=UPI0003799498|nr:ribosome biogenesis factor YjgA [Dasania marina]